MPGIYVSSKIHHAPMWREFRRNGLPICSTWIDAGTLSQQQAGELWPKWLKEAAQADAVLLYIARGDRNHTGCLMEIGAALSNGAKVFQVGMSDTFRTTMGRRADFMHGWKDYPTIDHAAKAAKEYLLSLTTQ